MNATLGILVSANTQQAQQGMNQLNTSINNTARSTTNLQNAVGSFGGGVQSFNSSLSTANATLGNTTRSADSASRSFQGAERAIGATGRTIEAGRQGMLDLSTAAGRGTGAINAMPPALNRLERGLRNSVGGSNQAINSLTNLGRVVQDAPYGFIGIANNLNPLLESFQRLQATTGSTGAAFRAMGQQLIGPAGIGIALSVVSTLLISFGDRLFGGTKRLNEAKVASDEFKFSLDSLSKEIERFRDNLQFNNEINKLKNELSGLTGGALALANANDDINTTAEDIAGSTTKIAPKVQELNQVTIALRGTADEYDRLKKIGDANPFITTRNIRGDETTKQNPAAVQAKAMKNFAIAAKEFIQFGKVSEEVLEGLSKSEKQQIESAIALSNTVTKESEKIGQAQNKQVQNALRVKLAEKQLAKERIEEAKKANDQIISEAQRIKSELPGFFNVTLDSVLISESEKLRLSKLVIEAFRKLKASDFSRLTLNLPEEVVTIFGPTKIQLEKIELLPSKAVSIDTEKLTGFFKGFKVPVELTFDPDPIKTAKLKKIAEDIKGIFAGAFEDISTSVGESLGDAITGNLSGAQSILRVLGSLISQLGKALVQYGIVKAGLDKILGPGGIAIPGGVAIALGIAAIAAGQAFKSIKARAKGGPVRAGEPYLVGERGPELIVPQASGTVIPNGKFGGISGVMGQLQAIEVYGRLSGKDILLSNSRQGRYNNRNV